MAMLQMWEGYTACWVCLSKPEYVLIMSQCAWICLNDTDYDTSIYLKKKKNRICWICQNSECAWCSTKHKLTFEITEQLTIEKGIQNTVKHFRWRFFQKEQCLSAGGGLFLELRHFYKYFVKNTRKRGHPRKHFKNLKNWRLPLL